MSFGYQILGFGSGGTVVSSIAFQSSATSTAAAITLPSDVIAGDVMVLCQRAASGSIPSDVTPSGWTDVGAGATLAGGVRVSHKYKIAVAADASAEVTGMDGSSSDFKIVLVFRPDVAAGSVTVQDTNGEMTNGDPSAQVVNASGFRPPLAVIASFGETGGSQTGISFDPTETGSVTNTDLDAYYLVYNASPADVTVDLGDGGLANSLCSFCLEIA